MTLLTPAPVSTSRFTYVAAQNMFVADLSDLGRDFRFERVWNDACDVGLTMVSHKTGRRIVFAIEHEQRDSEGELQYIDLKPANRNEWGGGTVRLYND